MTTLAEHIIVAGVENRPPMLEKSMYDSWASHIRLFIKGKKHRRMMLDLIDNGPLVYPTVKENRQTKPKKYFKLTKAQQIQDDCDVQATNIILHGLPPDVYVLVNHQDADKDTWDRVKMLMKCTELSYQEHECRLYNLFDKFAYVQGETLEHPIECLNKAMAFLSTVASSKFKEKNQCYAGTGQPRVVKCYNCQGEGHMARQYTQLKRPRNAAWFKEKLMLAEAQEVGQILDEEQLVFLADPAVLMVNLSSCDPEVLFEDTNPSSPNDLLVLSLVEQMTDHVARLDKKNQTNKMVNESLTSELERYKERIAIFKQRLNEIDTLKENLSNNVKENESLSKTLTVFKTESKEKESKYIDKKIVFEKQNKELENIIYEIAKVQTIFNQIEAAIDQCSVDKNVFDIQIKQLRIDNDQLLNQIMYQEIVHIVANSMDIFDVKKSRVNDCSKYLELKTELFKKKDFIEKEGSNATDVPSSSSFVNDRNCLIWKRPSCKNNGTSPICLLSKALKTKSRLWNRRLSHLNFDTLNKLAKDGLARGIPKLKFQKDYLCSACALGKSKKFSHQPKAEDTNQEKLYLSNMDLCGPMRVESINEKKYILVIVDDYSRFTCVKFLRSKDEAPGAIIKCFKNIQVCFYATVRNVREDNGTEFVNQTLFPVATAPRAVDITDSHVSTSIDQDAHHQVSHQYKIKNILELFLKVLKNHQKHYYFMMILFMSFFMKTRLLKDRHLIDPSRSVSIIKQLKSNAMWCYFDAFLTSVEPKNFKQAMTEPSSIDAMQEEIHEFERFTSLGIGVVSR
nr:putative ribonuclease H-like domain-containing protein [Tanacetum cinerariifolium]